MFVESNASGELYRAKVTLSCKIEKKSDREIAEEKLAIQRDAFLKEQQEKRNAANEKRKATLAAKKIRKIGQ